MVIGAERSENDCLYIVRLRFRSLLSTRRNRDSSQKIVTFDLARLVNGQVLMADCDVTEHHGSCCNANLTRFKQLQPCNHPRRSTIICRVPWSVHVRALRSARNETLDVVCRGCDLLMQIILLVRSCITRINASLIPYNSALITARTVAARSWIVKKYWFTTNETGTREDPVRRRVARCQPHAFGCSICSRRDSPARVTQHGGGSGALSASAGVMFGQCARRYRIDECLVGAISGDYKTGRSLCMCCAGASVLL